MQPVPDSESAELLTPPSTPKTGNTGPVFESITTSTKFIAKSDCRPTSITVTANIIDSSGVALVSLWYRVGADQPYTQVSMKQDDSETYSMNIKALDTPGGKYGVWEFYLTADDGAGNTSQSPLDTSVQLLPCLG